MIVTNAYCSIILILTMSLNALAYSTPVAMDHSEPKTSSSELLNTILIAEFAVQRHQPERALLQYEPILKRINSPTLNERTLNLALQQQDWTTALRISQQWSRSDPHDVPAMFYLAHLALRNHHYELAAHTLDRIIDFDKNADLDGILKGIVPEDPQEQTALRDALQKSHSRHNPSILAMIAALDAQQGRFKDALRQIDQALTQRPEVPSFIILKANLYLASGQVDAAFNWLIHSNRRQRTPDVGLFEIEQLLKRHKTQLALNKMHILLRRWPQHQQLLFLTAQTHLEMGQFVQSDNYFKKLIHSDLYADQALYSLAESAARRGQWQQAIGYYQNVDGNLYQASRTALVNLYVQHQQPYEALQFLTQERISHPYQTSFLYQLQIQLLKSLNQSQRALEVLHEALEQIPDDTDLLYMQIFTLDPKQDQDQLDRILNRLIDLAPDNPTFLNAYAYILAQQQRNLDQARHYAEQAIRYSPSQPSILDTLGYIYLLQRDYRNALMYLAQAYKLLPSAGIGAHYALALYHTDQLEEFVQLRQQLQRNYPTNQDIQNLAKLDLNMPNPAIDR